MALEIMFCDFNISIDFNVSIDFREENANKFQHISLPCKEIPNRTRTQSIIAFFANSDSKSLLFKIRVRRILKYFQVNEVESIIIINNQSSRASNQSSSGFVHQQWLPAAIINQHHPNQGIRLRPASPSSL